ncbi:MAG TPA: nucleotidyltransferase domain-containing protein [Candidatus Omnitrophota bacterium]|nr:nucleotidyltransferase domain-containing protein [Candidatus Omnitrophota bacterium]
MISFRSGIKQQILNYFFLHESERAYVHQLARQLIAVPKNVHKALVQFEEQGILLSEYQGKERYFFLNKQYPLLAQYKEIFIKTAGVEAQLRKVFDETPEIKEAYIFGSYAKNKMGPKSDVDVLLIGEQKSIDIQKAVYPLQEKIGCEFNIINLTLKEFQERKKKKDQFIQSIFKEKIIKLK